MSSRRALPLLGLSLLSVGCGVTRYSAKDQPIAVLSEELVDVREHVDVEERLVVDALAVEGVHLAFVVRGDAKCVRHREETFAIREQRERHWVDGDGDPATPIIPGLIEFGLGAGLAAAGVGCIAEGCGYRDNPGSERQSNTLLVTTALIGGGLALAGVVDLLGGFSEGYRTVADYERVDRSSNAYACPRGPLPRERATLARGDVRIEFETDASGAARVDLSPLRSALVADAPIELVLETSDASVAIALDEDQSQRVVAALAAPERPSLREHVVAALPIEFEDAAAAESGEKLLRIFSAKLSERGLRLVPSSSIRAALQREKASSYRACVDEACQIELGLELAATVVLRTTVTELDGQCTVAAVPFDLRTHTTLSGAARQTECRPAAVRDALAMIATQLSE